jgi:hypothetical protein
MNITAIKKELTKDFFDAELSEMVKSCLPMMLFKSTQTVTEPGTDDFIL